MNEKWKEISITFFICILLIGTGTVGFSFLYQRLFQPKTIIGMEEEMETEEWKRAQIQYEKEILYPLSFWKEEEMIVQEEEHLFSGLYLINLDLYNFILEWTESVDLDKSILENAIITSYTFKVNTKEYQNYGLRYMFEIGLLENDDFANSNIVVVIDKNEMPILCQYNQKNLYIAEERLALDTDLSFSAYQDWSLLPSDRKTKLSDYLAQMDSLLKNEMNYYKFLDAITRGFLSMEKEDVKEYRVESLKSYSTYGEWKKYSDIQRTAYAILLNDYNIILYYDEESDKIFGYNIALNYQN